MSTDSSVDVLPSNNSYYLNEFDLSESLFRDTTRHAPLKMYKMRMYEGHTRKSQSIFAIIEN